MFNKFKNTDLLVLEIRLQPTEQGRPPIPKSKLTAILPDSNPIRKNLTPNPIRKNLTQTLTELKIIRKLK